MGAYTNFLAKFAPNLEVARRLKLMPGEAEAQRLAELRAGSVRLAPEDLSHLAERRYLEDSQVEDLYVQEGPEFARFNPAVHAPSTSLFRKTSGSTFEPLSSADTAYEHEFGAWHLDTTKGFEQGRNERTVQEAFERELLGMQTKPTFSTAEKGAVAGVGVVGAGGALYWGSSGEEQPQTPEKAEQP